MNGINFLVDTPDGVVYNSSCSLSISCNELGRIQPTDTIRVDSFTTAGDVNCPSFLARVADIQFKFLLPDDEYEHVHPAVGNPHHYTIVPYNDHGTLLIHLLCFAIVSW